MVDHICVVAGKYAITIGVFVHTETFVSRRFLLNFDSWDKVLDIIFTLQPKKIHINSN